MLCVDILEKAKEGSAGREERHWGRQLFQTMQLLRKAGGESLRLDTHMQLCFPPLPSGRTRHPSNSQLVDMLYLFARTCTQKGLPLLLSSHPKTKQHYACPQGGSSGTRPPHTCPWQLACSRKNIFITDPGHGGIFPSLLSCCSSKRQGHYTLLPSLPFCIQVNSLVGVCVHLFNSQFQFGVSVLPRQHAHPHLPQAGGPALHACLEEQLAFPGSQVCAPYMVHAPTLPQPTTFLLVVLVDLILSSQVVPQQPFPAPQPLPIVGETCQTFEPKGRQA